MQPSIAAAVRAAFAVVLLLSAVYAGPLVSRAQTPDDEPYLTGRLLVAAPHMADPRFAETVIYVVSHDADGAMGLIVNRIVGTGPIASLLEALDVDTDLDAALAEAGDVQLAVGGPVEPQRGFVLHSDDFEGASTRIVGEGIAVSFGKDVLAAMAEGGGPERKLVLLGYAGWGPGQLESELARDDWQVVPAEISLIFSDDPDTVWDRAREGFGIEL